MGESRTELLQWMNDLLQINYTKVEQCGTGAAYCQIMDSIYGDLPMARVKFTTKQEYEYLANFKILQNFFRAKKIDRPIPVERLVKCKMQDNLEFLQWIRRYWDQTFGGQPYDAVGRRKGAPAEAATTFAPLSTGRAQAAAPARPGGKTPVGGPRAASSAASNELALMRNENAELRSHLEGLEKERDFYFSKLRDIEILVQQHLEPAEDAPPPIDGRETLEEIQKILYSTEEGFEVPNGEQPLDEEETF